MTGYQKIHAPQQQRSREKYARILEATGRLLEQSSYEELGTKLIAAEAEVSIGVLYRFFPDKEAIVASLVRAWLERFVEIFDRTTAAPLPAQRRALFERLLAAYADFYRDEPGFRRVWFGGPRLPSIEADGDANDRELAARLHAVLVASYGLPDGAATRRRTLLAVQIADRMLNLAFRDDPRGDPTVLAEAALLLDGYLAPELR